MTIVCPEIKYVDGCKQHRDGFYMDNLAMQVCETIIARVKDRNQDTVLIMNGREGSGKTNAAICMAYYMSKISGRTFTNANIYFDMKEMMKFAGSTKEQIILWDEGALGGLANDWTNETQKKLNAFLMICRKLKHIFIFCIPRFYRLSPNIIERAHVMLHMFEDNNEKAGNFIIIGQQSLEELYNEWRSTRKANYFHYKKAPPGHFSFVMEYLIDNVEYEQRKSEAIAKLAGMVISNEPKRGYKGFDAVEGWKKNKLLKKPLSQKDFCAVFGVSDTHFREVLRGVQATNPTTTGFYYNPKDRENCVVLDGVDVDKDYNDYVNEHQKLEEFNQVSTSKPNTICEVST